METQATPRTRPPLGDEQRRQFAGLVLLDRVAAAPADFHAALMGHKDDALLEPAFRALLAQDLVTVGEDDHYTLTERGRAAYRKSIEQQQSYLAHFDIYARVDLAAGTFFDPEQDLPQDPRWSDLRVAVAEYKGIDPYQMVFLAMLAGGDFFADAEWRANLALGSPFFAELERIVASQITVEELGYRDEDGSEVPGSAVIEDVILQGARLNRERWERDRDRVRREAETQPSLLEQPDGGPAGPAGPSSNMRWVYVYDPWAAFPAYVASALFVESLWLAPHW
ncbi:MAG: hypothetical protein HY423_03785 [Candidatus Lambdaproteobacteria bacterium]|nr:hypothetical protein [Candidatus Lambdaproteobacteria bacterium]